MSVHVGYTVTDNTVPQGDSFDPSDWFEWPAPTMPVVVWPRWAIVDRRYGTWTVEWRDEPQRLQQSANDVPDITVEFGPQHWTCEILAKHRAAQQFPRHSFYRTSFELAVHAHWQTGDFHAATWPVPPRPGYDWTDIRASLEQPTTGPGWDALSGADRRRPATTPATTQRTARRSGRRRA